MTPPELVIFDCDGVIVDSETITNHLLQKEFARRGLDLTLDEIMRGFVGGTLRGVAKKAVAMGADLPETWIEDFYKLMYAELAKGTPLVPGIEGVMDKLDAAGIPYAVGSNGSLEKMGITIGQHAELNARLKGNIYSAYVIGIPKPEPDMFLLAAKDRGIAPENCVVVDDSPTGCTAGIRAGMRTMGFAEHDDGASLKAVGAEPFHRMSDLPGLLGL